MILKAYNIDQLQFLIIYRNISAQMSEQCKCNCVYVLHPKYIKYNSIHMLLRSKPKFSNLYLIKLVFRQHFSTQLHYSRKTYFAILLNIYNQSKKLHTILNYLTMLLNNII